MSIRASAVARDITPKGEVHLAGFTGSARVSTGVRDPILASAVHLRGGSGGVIVVSFDLLHLDPSFAADVRQRIIKATGTRDENIFLGTTLNHSGPVSNWGLDVFNDPSYADPDHEYLDFVAEEAVQAASGSAVTSRPASVASIQLDTPGTGALIVRETATGRAMAAIIVHREKANKLGSVNTEISSDFVHTFRAKLSAKFGGDPVIVYYAGPSEDADNIVGGETVEAQPLDEPADSLMAAILDKVKNLGAADFRTDISFAGEFHELVSLPRRQMPSEHEAAADVQMANELVTQLKETGAAPAQLQFAGLAKAEASMMLNFVAAQRVGKLAPIMRDYHTIKLHKLMIGDITLMGIPGAITEDCGDQLTAQLGPGTWIIGCINGDMQGSLLFVDHGNNKQYRLLSPLFKPDAAQSIAAAAVSLARK